MATGTQQPSTKTMVLFQLALFIAPMTISSFHLGVPSQVVALPSRYYHGATMNVARTNAYSPWCSAGRSTSSSQSSSSSSSSSSQSSCLLTLQASSSTSSTSASSSSDSIFQTLCNSKVINPRDGSICNAIDKQLLQEGGGVGSGGGGGNGGQILFNMLNIPKNNDNNNNNNNPKKKKTLLILFPQLGEFDSTEYGELLHATLPDLAAASMALRIVGIGNAESARRFCNFTGLPLECVRVDPEARIHAELGLHRGPDWDGEGMVPEGLLLAFARFVGAIDSNGGDGNDDDDDDVEVAKKVFRSWVNYMAMCAGISAPGTLPEILRGYFGDKSAPERLRPNDIVTAGPVSITGTTDVKIGPYIRYQNSWKDEMGYQRPVELATVRLRGMVEVLTNFGEYVPDQSLIDWRGGTYVLDEDGNVIYEYRSRGVLTYSETMARPLSFLEPFIGKDRARNPLGLGDPEQ